MTHSPADILRYLLVALGHGTMPSAAGSWPIAVAQEPDDPDDDMTLYDEIGRKDGRAMVSGAVYEHHGVQLQLRCSAFTTGQAKLSAILTALDQDVETAAVAIDSSDYVVYAVSRPGTANYLGHEPESRRHIWTVSLLAAIRQTT